MSRSHLAPVIALGLIFYGCGSKAGVKADAGDDGGSGGDTAGAGGGGAGGSAGVGGSSGTGGDMGGTGGVAGAGGSSGTGGDMGGAGGSAGTGGDTGGTGGDTGGAGGSSDDGGMSTDAGGGNSVADCKAYCTCMAADCATQAPKKCMTACMAATDWDLSCRTMACMDVKKDPKMKASDCQHAIGMMGMCTNTGGGGGGDDAGAPAEDAATSKPDAAAKNTLAECKAYCTCMAADCMAEEPKNCTTTCMAAKTWDLACRTMQCLEAKKTPATKAMSCQYAVGMMGMCADM